MAGRIDSSEFTPPYWLRNAHGQTIVGTQWASMPPLGFARQRIGTPDNDFIDLDWNIPGLHALHGQHYDLSLYPRSMPAFTGNALLLFHGMEGSSRSRYAITICHDFRQQGWAVVVAHFRGCSGEPNRQARAYHSGDTQDVATVLHAVTQRLPNARWHAAGVSMGGCVLLKSATTQLPELRHLQGIASICSPLDLVQSARSLSESAVGKYVYVPFFLKTIKAKLWEKYQRYPTLIDWERIRQANTLQALDDAYTAPIHGFRNARDYWERSSTRQHLKTIDIPTLILNAQNDPFVPRESLPQTHEVSSSVLLHQPQQGGHVGFTDHQAPYPLSWLSRRLERFFHSL